MTCKQGNPSPFVGILRLFVPFWLKLFPVVILTAESEYAHGLLLESQFVPSNTNGWVVQAKINQKRPSQWP